MTEAATAARDVSRRLQEEHGGLESSERAVGRRPEENFPRRRHAVTDSSRKKTTRMTSPKPNQTLGARALGLRALRSLCKHSESSCCVSRTKAAAIPLQQQQEWKAVQLFRCNMRREPGYEGRAEPLSCSGAAAAHSPLVALAGGFSPALAWSSSSPRDVRRRSERERGCSGNDPTCWDVAVYALRLGAFSCCGLGRGTGVFGGRSRGRPDGKEECLSFGGWLVCFYCVPSESESWLGICVRRRAAVHNLIVFVVLERSALLR